LPRNQPSLGVALSQLGHPHLRSHYLLQMPKRTRLLITT
jgi:hypothetical protein